MEGRADGQTDGHGQTYIPSPSAGDKKGTHLLLDGQREFSVFQSSHDEAQPQTHNLTANFCTITKPL